MSPAHQDLFNDTTFSQIKSCVPVPLKGLVHQIWEGWVWISMDWSGLEKNLTDFLIYLLLLQCLAAILEFLSISSQNIVEYPEISENDWQMWAAILGDFLFPSQRTTSKV